MNPAQPAVLDVQKLGEGSYRFVLARSGEPFVGGTEKYWTAHVDNKNLVLFSARIDAVVLDANTGCDDVTAAEQLRQYGAALYRALLPRDDPQLVDLRLALRELSGPLLICADPSPLQWELLVDDERGEFLGLSHDVARRLKTRDAVSVRSIESGTLRCLLIADPCADEPGWSLPDAATEAGRLRDWLERRGVQCDVVGGAAATHDQIVDRIIEPYDLIHYAGHIVQHPDSGEFGWRLAEGELLLAGEIRRHLSGSPLVFLNGCWSASSGASNLEGVVGLTDAMLQGGARVVVGSIYPMPDIGARMFAERFYDEILSGVPFGAAMRAARDELSGRSELRASWAGFVMYGNPCMTLVVPETQLDDGLDAMLQAAGLRSDEFDDGAVEVVRGAHEHARAGGILGTPHLFAAMVAGPDGSLRERLAARGVEPDELRRAFQSALETAARDSDASTQPIELSANVRSILEAATRASRATTSKISERALLEGFVASPGDPTRQILLQLGIEPASLGGDPGATQDGATESRTVLELAAAIAINSGEEIISSPRLLQALLAVPASPLAQALRRVGAAEAAIARLRADPTLLRHPEGAVPALRRTENVEQVVLFAHTAAAAEDRAAPNDDDLFAAFVKQGGGKMGAALLDAGLPFDALTSPLFDDRGELRMECFDDVARDVLREALGCARRKHHEGLQRRHLLYGLLLADGTLAAAIRAQQHDPGSLADRLFVELPRASAPYGHHRLTRISHMSSGLVSSLCAADRCRTDDQEEQIAEAQLAIGLMSDGGGGAGAFLIEHGVSLRGLSG